MVALLAALAAPAVADAAAQTITSKGPITALQLTDDLRCLPRYRGGSVREVEDCFTAIHVAGTTYYESDLAGTAGPIDGTGTGADPYRVETTVDLPAAGLRIVQDDFYTTGAEFWTTVIRLENTTATEVTASIYRMMDCFRNQQDFGYGAIIRAGVRPYCTEAPEPMSLGRVLGLFDLSGGASFGVGAAPILFDTVLAGRDFGNRCECKRRHDTAVGLVWPMTIPGNDSAEVVFQTTFASPEPPPPTKNESVSALASAPAVVAPPPPVEKLAAGAPVTATVSGLGEVNCPCTLTTQLFGPPAAFGGKLGARLAAKLVPIGASTAKVKSGQKAKVSVRLTKTARRRLSRYSGRTLSLTVKVTARDAYGQSRVKIRRVKIRRLRPPPRRP